MFAAVFIPDFSLQAVLRHEPDLRARPVALVDPELSTSDIIQLTAAARACGVVEGLTASQALARCEDLIVKPRSRAQEAAATEVLLQTAYAFSPNIEATAPGVGTMDLKGLGLDLKNGSADSWAAKIIRTLEEFYLDAKIGLAATPELALLAARGARTFNIQHSTFNAQGPALENSLDVRCWMLDVECSHKIAIESLPLTALEPTPELLGILQRWGIQTIGAFLALGKDRVAERLGPAATELFDRVSPDSIRPLKLVAPPEEFREQMEFENEIETIEPLLFVLRRFVEQLSRRLELGYLVIAEFQLRLGLASGANYERTLKIPSPTGHIETLFRMLHTHLETVQTASPVTSLRLNARPARPESHQFGLFESTLRDPNQFAETLARLTALCGPDRVGTPAPEATHRPDAFRMGTPEFVGVHASACSPDNPASRGIELQHFGLPLRRFRPAISAQVEFREHRPVLLRSPVFTGAIAEIRGPFLSSGDWWDDARWAREEWDVQTVDGSLYRIFRSPAGCFVEGIYD